MLLRSAGIAILTIATAGGCTAGAPDLPDGWSGAQSMLIEQSACTADTTTSSPMPRLSADMRHGEGIFTFWYEDAVFRCGQEVCGYRLDEGPLTRVLIQPCEMRPSSVVRCDCLYDITFKLPHHTDLTTVELYRRGDLYGAKAPVPATLVDREHLRDHASH